MYIRIGVFCSHQDMIRTLGWDQPKKGREFSGHRILHSSTHPHDRCLGRLENSDGFWPRGANKFVGEELKLSEMTLCQGALLEKMLISQGKEQVWHLIPLHAIKSEKSHWPGPKFVGTSWSFQFHGFLSSHSGSFGHGQAGGAVNENAGCVFVMQHNIT